MRAYFGEFLFWLHALAIVFYVSLAFFLSLPVIILLTFLHRAHLVVFGECWMSRVQKRLGFLSHEMDFLQLVVKRLFQKNIDSRRSHYLDFSFAALTLGIASARYAFALI
jgi:hypothetical protein